MIKTPLNFWIRTIEIIFCIIIGFVFHWVAGVVIFVYGEILLILAQKEMAARIGIAMENTVQPEIDKLYKKLKDAEAKAKKIKFLRGHTTWHLLEGEDVEINLEDVSTIEDGYESDKYVRLKNGKCVHIYHMETIEK
jgi:diacylglycerol kinase